MADQLNWLVIGIGDITTRRVIPAIQSEPRSNFYGVVTRDPAKAKPYPGVQVWTELELALMDSAIDAVYVATPVVMHGLHTVQSFKAGKHVLCEKPVARTYEEAVSMVAAAREAGRTLGIAYYRRMYPKVQRAAELIQQGAIGQPVLAELRCHDWFDAPNGFRGWLLDPAMAGGGPLFDIASHRIDLLNYWFGDPKRATGQTSTVIHNKAAVEDSATVLVEYEGGVRGVVDVRWHSRVFRDEARIVGTEGAIELSPLNGPELVSPAGTEHLPTHENIHYPCIENFVSAVIDGDPLVSSGDSAILTDWVTGHVVLANR